MSKPKILVIAGPTASGKTKLSVELAKRYNGEIISADSMQIYRYMNIGTAKVTPEEMEGIPHYLIDILEPSESFSVAEFCRRTRELIDDITSRGKLPIIAGGTGLYITSLLDGVQFVDKTGDEVLRQELYEKAKEEGPNSVYAILQNLDPEGAKEIHPNNVIRVVRAIEMFHQTGRSKVENMAESKKAEMPYDALYLALGAHDRGFLYDRINRRVDIMMEQGLLEETKSLIENGFGQTSANAIGYKELVAYLEGRAELDWCISELKKGSRHYAKRQLTWFNRDTRARWLYIDGYDDYTQLIEEASHLVNDFLGK